MTPEEERYVVEVKNWNFDSEPAFLRLWSQPGCWWADLCADTCYKSLPSIHPAVLRQQQENLSREIEILNKTLQQQKTEHQAKVKDLCKRIRESKVTVEIESQNSNLTDIVKEIREKYDEIAKRNMEEMDEWYQKELKSLQEQENHHRSQPESAKSEYTKLLK
ncbi:keratin, type I cytoskeletal 18-B-like [Oryzias latipes]